MVRSLTALIEEYLLGWVLLAVAVGVLRPGAAVVTRAATPILAVMVGSVSLTLSAARFRAIEGRSLVAALAAVVLVVAGVGAVAVVPAATRLFAGGVTVDAWPIVEGLLVAVVAPMAVAIAVRTRYPARVERYEGTYPAISAVMVVLIIGGVTAANAELLRGDVSLVALVAVGALALNLAGYALGWLVTAGTDRPTRIAGALSVGMRDFAVAAALVVAAGFPPAAALPAVVFGVVEMTTSTGLARWLNG